MKSIATILVFLNCAIAFATPSENQIAVKERQIIRAIQSDLGNIQIDAGTNIYDLAFDGAAEMMLFKKNPAVFGDSYVAVQSSASQQPDCNRNVHTVRCIAIAVLSI